MKRTGIIIIGFGWIFCHLGDVICDNPQDSYGPSSAQEETEVEIQQVEVYEVPWIGDQTPQTNYVPPKSQYGPPAQEYGPPAQEYGPPPQEYGPPEVATTTSVPEQVESLDSRQNQTAKLQQEVDDISIKGQYYIYHPTGLLQRVKYSTTDDSKNMAFSARLQYENVDPIQGPIYTYNPDTYGRKAKLSQVDLAVEIIQQITLDNDKAATSHGVLCLEDSSMGPDEEADIMVVVMNSGRGERYYIPARRYESNGAPVAIGGQVFKGGESSEHHVQNVGVRRMKWSTGSIMARGTLMDDAPVHENQTLVSDTSVYKLDLCSIRVGNIGENNV
ncbi:unnamed protein product [Ceutorhynchus assimilis]|uniref:Uncharacterized protein n=1 Tax=Ceutorhynchus assimilis TaxID=467358 RepID=A0A9N9MQW1_9CUCU|nr:unnamed protein product [Ceutorhynchus assimilis]